MYMDFCETCPTFQGVIYTVVEINILAGLQLNCEHGIEEVPYIILQIDVCILISSSKTVIIHHWFSFSVTTQSYGSKEIFLRMTIYNAENSWMFTKKSKKPPLTTFLFHILNLLIFCFVFWFRLQSNLDSIRKANFSLWTCLFNI